MPYSIFFWLSTIPMKKKKNKFKNALFHLYPACCTLNFLVPAEDMHLLKWVTNAI